MCISVYLDTFAVYIWTRILIFYILSARLLSIILSLWIIFKYSQIYIYIFILSTLQTHQCRLFVYYRHTWFIYLFFSIVIFSYIYLFVFTSVYYNPYIGTCMIQIDIYQSYFSSIKASGGEQWEGSRKA